MSAKTYENVGRARRCLERSVLLSANSRLKMRVLDEARVETLVLILHNCAV